MKSPARASDNPILDFFFRLGEFCYTDIPDTPGNSNMGASHEREIRKLLELVGFQRIKLIDSGFTKQEILEKKATSNIKGPSFLKNPLGGSKHPDFILFFNGWVFYLELKSSKSSYNPKWGSAFPERNDIWIFTCGNRKINETTFFLGNDLIPDDLAREMRKFQIKELDRQRTQNKAWKDATGSVGLDLRPMKFNDYSKKDESIIFHPQRRIREIKVLGYVSYSSKWPQGQEEMGN